MANFLAFVEKLFGIQVNLSVGMIVLFALLYAFIQCVHSHWSRPIAPAE